MAIGSTWDDPYDPYAEENYNDEFQPAPGPIENVPNGPEPGPGNTESGPDGWATAPQDGNWQNWFMTNVQGTPATPESLAALEAKLTPHGIKVIRNAQGIAGKIQLPNGQIIDVGRAFSSGDPTQMSWAWQIGGNEYTAPDGSTVEIDPTYLSPFDEQFVTPQDGELPSDFDYQDYKPSGPFQYGDFSYDPFTAPDADAVLQDPGYNFRLDTGRKMLETSAAAKGLLNSGGTLNDLIEYGQSLGSQEYGNVFNRQFDTWRGNRDNAFGAWDANRNKEFSAWNANRENDLTGYTTNRDTALTEYGLAKANRDTSYQRAWDQYLERRNTFYSNQSNPFNKILSAAQVGAGAAAS